MNIQIKALSPEILEDYLYFFDNICFSENPHWSACYCFSFHFTGKSEEWKRDRNRASVINYVKQDKMRGYLAFLNNQPIGWCNANDRNSFQSLGKYYKLTAELDKKICAVVCFLIHPEYRRKGIALQLLHKVIDDYSARGYDYLEAYPGKGSLSDENHYKGPMRLYEEFNFQKIAEYDDYFIVRKKLN